MLALAAVCGAPALADELDVLDGFDDGGAVEDRGAPDTARTGAARTGAGRSAGFFAVAWALSPAACADLGLSRRTVEAAFSGLAEPAFWARAAPVSVSACERVGFRWIDRAPDLRGGARGFDQGDSPGAGLRDSDEPSFIAISGSIGLGASYNYAQRRPDPGRADYRGLSRARTDLRLQADLDLPLGFKGRVQARGFRDAAYLIKGRDQFTPQVLDEYESELELQEAYVLGSLLPSLDVKLGRQVLVWGASDTLRVLDVLNPLDHREPGLVDLEDLRIPVWMSRLDYYEGPFQVTGVAVHENRFSKEPVFGSDFFPFPFDLAEERPGNGGRDTEYALQVRARLDPFEFTLNGARYFEDDPFIDSSLTRRHSRVSMIGASGQHVAGNWILKTEYARIRGLEFFSTPGDVYTRSDFLLGAEYGGFAGVQLGAEVAVRRLHGFTRRLEGSFDRQRRNRVEASARYSQFFWNQTLQLNALAIVLGEQAEEGAILRVSADYAVRDALRMGLGLLVFQGGDLIDPFDANDRIFMDLKYSF